jgi:hypothetical protein
MLSEQQCKNDKQSANPDAFAAMSKSYHLKAPFGEIRQP